MTKQQTESWQLARLDWIVFAGVIFLGLLRLSYPFHGDQALFTLGAKVIQEGGVLYRDFWDLKQPGIYAFYLLAGKLFSFNEPGIHLFELLYMTAFAVVLRLTLSSYYQSKAIARLVPFLTVGVYYFASTTWHLTQVEGLVGFPLFLVLWFSTQAIDAKTPKFSGLFLSGIMGGIVLLFKLLFLPILGTFWVIVLFHAVRKNRLPWLKTFVQMGIPIALGLSLPVLIVLGYFAHLDLLGLLYQTFIEYPPRIAAELPKPGLARLFQGVSWWINRFAPLILLSGFFISHALMRPPNVITQLLVSWLGVGLFAITIQRQSWWEYHYLLLFVPLGLLAGKGIELLLVSQPKDRLLPPSWQKKLIVLIIILLIVPSGFSLLKQGRTLARYDFALTPTDRLAYQSRVFPGYAEALKETAFLKLSDSKSGDIYVCGQPLYYFLSGRGQAIPLNGWSLEFLVAEQWHELRSQLDKARPAYIFVSSVYTEIIAQHPPIADFLAAHYRSMNRTLAGVWYVHQGQ